ncbi:uncharacterized protein [Dermacentor albipictus]|uniref:uncharacterized protein isoform X2 n=1 Tax=Dermacentor albipictus TaxID=60249 RepID=UPI0038FBFD3C
MGIAVSSGVLDVPSLLHGGASAFSEASSPQKLPSFTMHVLLPDEAADDVLPRNGDLVVKTLDAAEEEARSSCAPHRRRLVPGAECDRIVEKDAKDNLAEYNSLQAPCTVQGHRHLVEEVSRDTGHWVIYRKSPEEPTTRAAAAAGSGNRQHRHCSAVAWPDYRFEALRCRPRVHPARHAAASVDDDELPHGRVQQRRGGNAKQLPSEATHEFAPPRVAGNTALSAPNSAQRRQEWPTVSGIASRVPDVYSAAPCPGCCGKTVPRCAGGISVTLPRSGRERVRPVRSIDTGPASHLCGLITGCWEDASRGFARLVVGCGPHKHLYCRN